MQVVNPVRLYVLYVQCLACNWLSKLFANTHCIGPARKKHIHAVVVSLPRSHGATHSLLSLALFRMVSGSGKEWRTMAPYSPYSAMMVLRPQHFSVLRHFARRFWNQTCAHKEKQLCGQAQKKYRCTGVHKHLDVKAKRRRGGKSLRILGFVITIWDEGGFHHSLSK